MRLKHIKLAGFKSFVDPTTVTFPSNLCAVVGPNGCGKSNVIDAVRWVMGESSAKHLRGESMADVIFNGSGSRKPIGQASVELLFDNSGGASKQNILKGEYANYSEIAIKRKVTRDGKNDYFLNGARCRRRDIIDIFLGTGLGSRSYGIIEQGTISRLIEAKPEELRVFIEEAAGISKYKDRRRDTENRMRRTLENLDRLTDLRDELDRQLSRLKRQSQSAEQYAQLKREERQLKANLQALRHHLLGQQVISKQQEIQKQEIAIESIVAKQLHQQNIIEKCRAEHVEKTDVLNEVQTRFYAIGTDIARIEQDIYHAQERNRQLQANFDQVSTELQQVKTHLAGDSQKAGNWRLELAEMESQLLVVSATEKETGEELQVAEQAMQAWQQQWDEFNRHAAEPKQQVEVEQSRIQHSQKLQQRLSARREALEQERTSLEANNLTAAVEPIKQELAELRQTTTEKHRQIENINNDIQQLRKKIEDESIQLDRERNQLQTLRGRHASLEALQQDALDNGEQINQWLKEQTINDNPRLIDGLTVVSRWQHAVEMVLGHTIQAVAVDNIDEIAHSLPSLTQGELVLVDGTRQRADNITSSNHDTIDQAPLLASQVTSDTNLSGLLNGIYTSENLNEALSLQKKLADDESIVTPEGFWLGVNWLRIARRKDGSVGILARKQQLESLEQSITAVRAGVDDYTDRLQNQRQQLHQLEQQREVQRRNVDEHNRRQSKLQSELDIHSASLAHQTKRLQQIDNDMQETHTQLQQETQNLSRARAQLEDATRAIAENSLQHDKLSESRDQLRTNLEQARQQFHHSKDKHHALAMQHQLVKTQLASVNENLDRLAEQDQRLEDRRQQLAASLQNNEDPATERKEELEVLLQQRIHIEAALAEARDDCNRIEQQIQQAEKCKVALETELKSLRSQLEQLRLDRQTLTVQQQTIASQIDEKGGDLQALVNALPTNAEEQTFAQSLEAIGRRIDRLGPINLAAIDEYQSELERKQYLDAQNDDLREALSTLESAIKKIDQETRARFKATYEQVNSGLQALFPKVFGGGHAYLEMTGEDLLDTGVTIMARPPGKRNSTIHLLSGGEKALTAVALIFSIFQLNPAPFCMLDEVDAPLDDINVNRYSRLLEEMSDKVQFIYITHNKISMEVAHQLMGVTMHEAGVSRLVTVDVDQAVELAAV